MSKNSIKREKIYNRTSNNARVKLLQLIKDKCTMIQAAKLLNINYSTAKTIMRVYRRENRIFRKVLVSKKTQKIVESEEKCGETNFESFSLKYDQEKKEEIEKKMSETCQNILMRGIYSVILQRQMLSYQIHENSMILRKLVCLSSLINF